MKIALAELRGKAQFLLTDDPLLWSSYINSGESLQLKHLTYRACNCTNLILFTTGLDMLLAIISIIEHYLQICVAHGLSKPLTPCSV